MLRAVQLMPIAKAEPFGDHKLCFQLGARPSRVTEEKVVLTFCAAAIAFGYIARHRDGGSPHLICEAEAFDIGKFRCEFIDRSGQVNGFLPDDEVFEGLSHALPPCSLHRIDLESSIIQPFNASVPQSLSPSTPHSFVFIWGKRITSRIEREPVSSIVRRSTPTPSPPV